MFCAKKTIRRHKLDVWSAQAVRTTGLANWTQIMFEEESLCGAINENMKLKAASSERLEGVDLSGVHYRPCLQKNLLAVCTWNSFRCASSQVIFWDPRGHNSGSWLPILMILMRSRSWRHVFGGFFIKTNRLICVFQKKHFLFLSAWTIRDLLWP